MSLRFQFAWLEAPGVTDPALAATWASITIRIGEEVVSEAVDERLNAARGFFFGSALPIAEWIADVWPRLTNERRKPLGADAEWDGFHQLRGASEGGALPDLRVWRRTRSEFALDARPDGRALAPGISLRFIREAQERAPALDVERELARVVEAVLSHVRDLASARIDRLRCRWEAVRQPEARILGRMGVDDEFQDAETRAEVHDLTADPRCELLVSLAEGMSGPSVSSRLAGARAAMKLLPESAPASRRWNDFVHVAVQRQPRPWLTGWSAAEEWRRIAGIDPDSCPGTQFPELVESKCGWPASSQVAKLRSSGVDGIETIHLRRAGAVPTVLTTAATSRGRRFRIARALYHFIFGSAEPDEDVLIADSPLIPGELSEANAFAAELLAPVAWLRTRIPQSGVWTRRDVRGAARELAVSPRVVWHQIQNRGLGVPLDQWV